MEENAIEYVVCQTDGHFAQWDMNEFTLWTLNTSFRFVPFL